MKKMVSLFLVVIVLVSLVACSNVEQIDEKLQGVWKCQADLYSKVYTFDDGEYEEYMINMLGENTYKGEYTIRENGIYFGATSEPSITYTLDKDTGKLRLWDPNGVELTLFYADGD